MENISKNPATAAVENPEASFKRGLPISSVIRYGARARS
jgi:hypothetical protein